MRFFDVKDWQNIEGDRQHSLAPRVCYTNIQPGYQSEVKKKKKKRVEKLGYALDISNQACSTSGNEIIRPIKAKLMRTVMIGSLVTDVNVTSRRGEISP